MGGTGVAPTLPDRGDTTMVLLQEGDVIEIKEGHRIYATVPEHFRFANRNGVFDKLSHGLVTVGGELSYLAGVYIVYKTTKDGGGTGHGPGDVYPNGHHVFCEKHRDPKVMIDFYQTGGFTAMIPEIDVVGRASRTWSWD